MPTWERDLSRRSALRAVGTIPVLGLAGCPGDGDEGSGGQGETPTTNGRPAPERQLPAPTMGEQEAPVTVAAYEDLACSHCRRYTREVQPALRSEYVEPGDIRYEWHDYPLPMDETHSWLAADAARSVQANADSIDAFWAFTERVFENQDDLSLDLYETLANEVGVDGGTVREETTARTFEPTVVASKQQGRDRNVSGTPTVFVEDNRLEGPTFEVLRNAIEDELTGGASSGTPE